MRKFSKKTWLLLFLILVAGYALLITKPFKVIEPTDPRFKVENFRFEDYPGIPPLTDALRTLLPVGTSRETVEKMLIQAGDAKLDHILSAEQINKNNKAVIKEFPEHARSMVKPVKDYYIYGRKAKYLYPVLMPRYWAVGVQYDDNNKLSLLALNGSLINGEINFEEIK